MIKNFILLCTVISLFVSCSLDREVKCEPAARVLDDGNYIDSTKAYLDRNGITASYDSTAGFFYTIAADGTGKRPNHCSKIQVNYKGILTDSTIFDQNTKAEMDMQVLIPGWRYGLQYIKEGGIITLYLPAHLAYGAKGIDNAIPPKAITIFTIELITVY
jgi:FKBP-type peptidyl-prolyl cis-trans isomerase